MKNVNKNRIISLLLAGGITLVGAPKVASAENKKLTTEEIVALCEANVQKQLSYEEFCVLCYENLEYLKSFGLDISLSDMYDIVYVANYAYIKEDVKIKLISNGFISKDYNVLITNALSMCSIISTYNDNIYINALNNKTNVDRNSIINVSNLSINDRDKYIANTFNERLADFIDDGKISCDIYTDLYNGFVKIPTSTNYKMEQASIGFEKIINLTSGACFYALISDMHELGKSIVASEQDLNILSEHIHDIGNVEVALKSDLANKQSIEVVPVVLEDTKEEINEENTVLEDTKEEINEENIEVKEFVNIENTKNDLSYEEFCVLTYNIQEYLKSFNLDISLEELYGPVYVQNVAYISEETKQRLIENGLISEDIDTLLNYEFSLLSIIATYNDNVYIKGLEQNKKIEYNEIINISNLLINENDKQIADLFDNNLTDYINSGKKNENLYYTLFANYKKQKTENIPYYGLDQASVGALVGINLSSGGNFFAHIGSMHPVDGKTIATDDQLMYLSEDIHDINEICTALGEQCKKIK